MRRSVPMLLGLLFLTGSSATGIDVSAFTHRIGEGLQRDFSAGTHTLVPIDPGSGGAFTAWNTWNGGQVTGCDVDGRNCTTGWLWTYTISCPSLGEVDVNQVAPDGTNGRYASPALAFANAAPFEFTLDQPETCSLFMRDGPGLYVDNVGGVSLEVADATAECVPPPLGVISWWTFDEVVGTAAHDVVGGLDGAYVNGPMPDAGIVGGALRFDGSNDFVSVPDDPAWAFGADDFTIEFWASFDTPGGGSIGNPGDIFIGNDEGPGSRNKWFFALGGGFLNFHLNGPGTGSRFFPLVAFTPAPQAWHHLAITRDGDAYTIYVDGQAEPAATDVRLVPDASAPLTIGQAEGFFFDGRLDEMTVYERALSPEQIAAIAAAGSAGKCRVQCETHLDCDDGNECTSDTCSADGRCARDRANEEETCEDGLGQCREGQCVAFPADPRADLDLLTVCRPVPACPDGTVRCDIHVRNQGPSLVPELTVEMILTEELRAGGVLDPLKVFRGFGSTGPIGMGPAPTIVDDPQGSEQRIEWTVSNVPAGGKAATWFTLDAGTAGSEKRVRATGSVPDPFAPNDATTELIVPDASLCPTSDFADKSGVTPRGDSLVCPAETIFYVIVFEREGASRADVVDVLDPCLDPATVSALLPPEHCSIAGDAITCNELPLDANGAGQVSFAAQPRLDCPLGTTIRNVATISFDEGSLLVDDTAHELVGCEQICNDGIDNDEDGLTDCEDPDCQDRPCDADDLCRLCNAGVCEDALCPECGDGAAEGAEACDGADLGGQICESLGFDGGQLACTDVCALDPGACFSCGDGLRDPGEACDGADLGGESCVSFGFGGGGLACTTACEFDLRDCEPLPPAPCDVDGNGFVDRFDIDAIFSARGQGASGPDDPRDRNEDGIISVNDGRLCVLECSEPDCEPVPLSGTESGGGFCGLVGLEPLLLLAGMQWARRRRVSPGRGTAR
ncbi:MAG: LamG domain-containing protein [Myxococcota bacterium]|nr:LamG domain-containing protein [Myxococcota bacterium]